MTVSDPIADMLTRIRNGVMARHDSVLVPASKQKVAIAKVLKEDGFIGDFDIVKDKTQRMIKIQLKYSGRNQPILSGVKRVSKPGMRVYVGRGEIPRVAGGLGTAIISTPKGVMTGQQAWRQGTGGELLCFVW
ncbi:MAG: 30S ribosomal protein S8 [Chloroflexi bacterium]|nr:30S ribosomal protein S8 [Chloroflexota bacterium]